MTWQGGRQASWRTRVCAAMMPAPILVVAFVVVFVFGGVAASAATPGDCQALRKHGHRTEAQACYDSLTQSREPAVRAEGFWGLENYQQANVEFRTAVAQTPTNANYRVRWGRLLHERFNNNDAENLFKEALEIDAKNAPAYVGMALVSADGFDSKDKAVAEADEALKISPEALDAMAIHAAVELLADRSPDEWFAKMRRVNPVYGEGYALVAYHLVLNRRYKDGITYYRKAIELDPQLWSAHSQLGINLMRLGQEDEPRQQLTMSYDNGYRDAATVNSLRLLDSYKNFVTYKDGNTILRLNKKEADLLHPYVEEVAKRAIATYEKKYKMKLDVPVQVEVYPDHEDFAVRTMGMPGLGALGVTFDDVIAMDSPSGREPGSFHWGSTLWHEMSHVFILTATNYRVPRWFTEGLAVHEETEASPEWGDRITPDIVVALADKKLLPVADLDRGFIRPDYPAQVIVSYFQAGRICDYIQSRWGADKLLDMVHAFAQQTTTAEVIQKDLGMAPEEFDKQFMAWLDQSVGKTVASFDEWHKDLKSLVEMAKIRNYDEMIKQGEEVRRLYPDYVYDGNAYEFLAEAHLAKGDKKAAAAALTDYEKLGGRSPGALKQLAALEEELGQPKEAAATLDRLNYIYPVNDEEMHRHLGDLWLAQNNFPGAIREYNAVVVSHPLDQASAQYNLAHAYFAAGQRDQAEEHLLAALEAAPGYRPAQKLLLEIKDAEKGQ